jgi:site-specific recombinase XerD
MSIPDGLAVREGQILAVIDGPPRTELHPVDAYLATLAPSARTTIRGCLNRLARIIAGRPDDKSVTAWDIPWWRSTASVATLILQRLNEQGWSPAHINKHLTAYRRVLYHCWRLDLMTTDQRDRASDIKNIEGSRLPAGRAVAAEEHDALLEVCDDGSPKGSRDAALIALMYATGARRDELSRLMLTDWDPAGRTLRVRGKRNKERLVPVAAEAVPWLRGWLWVRKWEPGPLFCQVRKNGAVVVRRLSGSAMRDVLDERCKQAQIQGATPHDFRRTMVGDLLDEGVDLATVQKIAGHVSPTTTARYDRREDATRLAAVDRLHMRQPKNTPGEGADL